MSANRQAQGYEQQPQPHRQHKQGFISDRINNSLRRRSKKPERSEINPFVKYFLFFLNFIIFVLGAAMLALGIYILVVKEKSVNSVIEFIFDPALLVLTTGGAIITVLSFFGTYGSLRENTCFLQTYSVFMAIMLLLQVILIVFVFIFYFMPDTLADMEIFPEKSLEDAIIKYRDDPDMQGLIDNIQELLSCCGVAKNDEGYKDWNKNQYFKCDQDLPSNNIGPESCSVPYSCCRISNGDNINYQCGAGMLRDDALDRNAKIYTQGCLKGLESVIKDNIWIYGGIIIGILLPQAAIICCAKALIFQIKEQKYLW